ncbi:Protein of unknown function (DUF2750) [[Clostridium] sordellii]|uniref:DUF2750 domain-containing protein n=1 Tax=Paraclostridium sordellii TaxID=1505 RepID=UPI0005435560|nr:DUF2750 domain-containing protein [Paeniclostridium sordellii]CEK35524.1 Protein of unknown function (DUF2750) [[Clostridium] sordellii] [Paeniclostridium sordellii]
MNTKEFKALMSSSAKSRYEYFIKKVIDFEEVWGLYDKDGWAVTSDEDGRLMLPFWPKREFANACAIDEWKSYISCSIDLNEFLEDWLPDMKEDGVMLSIFWNNNDSVVVKVESVLNDLLNELEKY